jgi:hypothetical protein
MKFLSLATCFSLLATSHAWFVRTILQNPHLFYRTSLINCHQNCDNGPDSGEFGMCIPNGADVGQPSVPCGANIVRRPLYNPIDRKQESKLTFAGLRLL